MANAKQLREKLAAKQDELGKVFAEAKTDDGLDFNAVKCLGDQVKGSVAVADAVRQMNAELKAISIEAETIEAAEQAAGEHADREKTAKRPTHAAMHDGAPAQRKSFSEQISENADLKAWIANGSRDGVTMKFADMMPSDMLASNGGTKTLQQKALFETTAGWGPESTRIPGFVDAVTRPIQLLDIIPMARTGNENVLYMEETTRTHAAAETIEGGTYAESAFVLTEQSSPVRKITDSLPVTDEQLEDVAQVESYINDRLIFGVRQRLDQQVLIGDGIAPNLTGIANTAGILTQAMGADPLPDAFYKLMTSIRTVGQAIPTHSIIHPIDWQAIRLLRTTDGIYIWGSPSETGSERLWGLPVIQSDADAAGTAYVGSFMPQWVSLHERSGVDVQVGYTGSQFVEGKRTIRASMRTAFTIFRPSAFGSVTGIV